MAIQLTPEEKQVLTDVLDQYSLQLQDTRDSITEDPSIDSIETLLELTATSTEQEAVLLNIRDKLEADEDEDDG